MNVPRVAASLLRQRVPSALMPVRHNSGLPFGRRQLEQAKNWIPSLSVYGTVAGGLLVYFTDWRVVTDFIPFYNGKYHDDDE